MKKLFVSLIIILMLPCPSDAQTEQAVDSITTALDRIAVRSRYEAVVADANAVKADAVLDSLLCQRDTLLSQLTRAIKDFHRFAEKMDNTNIDSANMRSSQAAAAILALDDVITTANSELRLADVKAAETIKIADADQKVKEDFIHKHRLKLSKK